MPEVNGTTYHQDTPRAVIEVLERARLNRTRLTLDFGNRETGQSWGEHNDTRGTIGRSMGPMKVPLLITTTRTTGGGHLLDHCIVRIVANGRELYRHPTFQPAKD